MNRSIALGGVAAATMALMVVTAAPAMADSIGSGTARAYGATVEVGGETVVPPTPTAEVIAPPGNNVSETLIDIPADPLAVSGTLTATARVHGPSDIPSALTVETQAVPGPYNVQGVALIEGLDVLLDVPADDVSLVSADVVRAEAVAVCTAGAVQYSANSEIIDLRVGGEEIPLNAPVQDLVDAIGDVLEQSGLNQVVDVQRNVVTTTATGISVDALVVTLLAAAGESPLARVVIGHAEASSAACGTMPECSDGVDNDGDGFIDFPNDPECTDAQDNNEGPDAAAAPQCSDTVDNDGDGVADAADPGCHTDGDASNTASYDPTDDDETNPVVGSGGGDRGALARTGGETSAAIAVALAGLGALGFTAIRRARSLI